MSGTLLSNHLNAFIVTAWSCETVKEKHLTSRYGVPAVDFHYHDEHEALLLRNVQKSI